MERPRIWVIDDEPDLLENYVSLLGDDFEVNSFSEPEKLLAHLSEGHQSPDLLITDLKMPKIDGLEMIRQAQTEGHYFPFILLSGYLDKKSVMDAVEVGVFRLLEKPISFDLLLSSIDELLVENRIHQVRREVREITSQLRELYTGIRLVMDQYIPPEVMDRFVVEAPQGLVKKTMSFEELLENLEGRLENLLESEKVLEGLRNQP